MIGWQQNLFWLIEQLFNFNSNISWIWWRHYCHWLAAKVRHLLGAYSLWAVRDFYRATHTPCDKGLGFTCSGIKRRTASFSCFVQYNEPGVLRWLLWKLAIRNCMFINKYYYTCMYKYIYLPAYLGKKTYMLSMDPFFLSTCIY